MPRLAAKSRVSGANIGSQAAMLRCAQVADISDVVRQRADALMLSGESAVGAYPDKAVNVLRQVATRIEEWVRCVASLTELRAKSQEPSIMALFTPAHEAKRALR